MVGAMTMFTGLFFATASGAIGSPAANPSPRAADQLRREALVTYEYDSLHRLTKVTYSSGLQITYEYDAVGNRTMRLVVAGS